MQGTRTDGTPARRFINTICKKYNGTQQRPINSRDYSEGAASHTMINGVYKDKIYEYLCKVMANVWANKQNNTIESAYA